LLMTASALTSVAPPEPNPIPVRGNLCRASTGSPRTAAPSAAFYKWHLARSCHLSRYRASTGCGVLA